MTACSCPIEKEWRINGKRFRRSMKTRNYQKALATVRREEIDGIKQLTSSPIIKDACGKYLEDAQSAGAQKSPHYISSDCCFVSSRSSLQTRGWSSFQTSTWITCDSFAQPGRIRTKLPV